MEQTLADDVELMAKNIVVGWIGTGVMGKSMAGHLIKNGYKLVVNNRTASKADDLVAQGATYCESAVDVAKQSDVVILMLGYPRDVEDMLFHQTNGISKHLKKGAILIDHTTSSPGLALRIHEAGINAIDAPVSGGDIGAKNGCLVTMIGGDKATVDRSLPIMNCYSANCKYMGTHGAGHHTKMANQIMIGTTMIGLCESLLYAHKAGLNIDEMIKLLQKGAAGSFSLEKLGPRMLKRDFEPGFYVEHFVKDLGIALDEAKGLGLALPGTAMAQQFYHALVAQGGARMGTQGLLTTLEKFNNTEIKKYDI